MLVHFCDAVDSSKTHALMDSDEAKVIWAESVDTNNMTPLGRYLTTWMSRSARHRTKTQGCDLGLDFGKLPTNDEVITNDFVIPVGSMTSNSSSVRTKNDNSLSILQMMPCIIISSSSGHLRTIVEVPSLQMSRERIVGFVWHRWSLRRRSMWNQIACSGETMAYCIVHL
jgi:hypothetical protein